MGQRTGLDGCGISGPHRDSIPDHPARTESLYRLSYPGPQPHNKVLSITIYLNIRGREKSAVVLNTAGLFSKTSNRRSSSG